MPTVCGDCRWFERRGKRSPETGGRQPGTCQLLGIPVSRTDWCQEDCEKAKHAEAMRKWHVS